MRPLVYLKTAWMEHYSGSLTEPIEGKHRSLHQKLKRGQWVGMERFNFKATGTFRYGFAPFYGTVRLSLVGGDDAEPYLDGVDVAFIARRPKTGGVVVIGWYKNARLYRQMQYRGQREFLVRSVLKNTRLLPVPERRLIIPITQTAGPRSPALWYGTPSTNRSGH